MKGAILFTGKFGSTQQYARWISEHTSFPVFNLNKENPDPTDYDLLVLGSSIMLMKPTIKKWLTTFWPMIKDKQIVLFTVSGTKPGHPDLQKWINNSFSKEILMHINYIPLRGRLNLNELPWLTRFLLKLGAILEKDPETKQRMTEGFDYMVKSNISQILKWVSEKKERKLALV